MPEQPDRARPSPDASDFDRRLRNLLAMVRSMTRRSAQDAVDVETYAARLDGRIAALARAQLATLGSPDATMSLECIVLDELLAHAIRPGRGVTIAIADIGLDAKAGSAMALALHELVVNSIENGALSAADGHLAIKADTRHGHLFFEWSETYPVGDDRDATFERFARDYLVDGLAYDIGGSTTLNFRDGVTSFSMDALGIERFRDTSQRPRPDDVRTRSGL